jgi:hypothetical protein
MAFLPFCETPILEFSTGLAIEEDKKNGGGTGFQPVLATQYEIDLRMI